MFGKRKQFSWIVIVAGIFFFASNVFSIHAALKDSDVDGLTDEAEINVYHTNPNNPDTDGDGFDDGYEVANHTDPLDPKSFPIAIRSENVDTGLLIQMETAYARLGLPWWAIWVIAVVGSIAFGFLSMLIAAFLNTFIASASIPTPVSSMDEKNV